MENQVLSIERMRHLQELGIELGKTLLYWAISKDNNPRAATHYGKWILTKGNSAQVVGMTSWEFVPAFTLQDIIEELPKELTLNSSSYNLILSFSGENFRYEATTPYGYDKIHIEYFNSTGFLKRFNVTLIDAAYNMLCWCAENGYLRGWEK